MESTLLAPVAGKMSASEFLSFLFPATPGYLALWRGDTKATTWIHAGDWAKADAYVERANAVPFNAYVGVCLQARDCGPESRGEAKTTTAVPGVWVDLDFQDKPHTGAQPRKKNYPPRAIVEKCLDSLPIPASLRIFTGGGIHAYWALKSPFIIQTDSDRQRIAEVVKAWQGGIKSWLLKAGGYGVDSTFDLARVLRIPGSPHTSHPGLIVDIDPAMPGTRARYSLEEIEGHLRTGSQPATPARSPPPHGSNGKPAKVNGKPAATPPTDEASRDCSAAPQSPAPSPADPPAIYASEASEPPAGRLENLIAASSEFAALWEGRTKRPSPSEYDMSLANFAKNAEWTDNEAAGLLVAFARRQMPDHIPKLLRVTGGIQDYLRLTLDKAKEKRIPKNGSPANGDLPAVRVTGVTLEKVGKRIYFVGNAFPIKDQIKEAGGHWDDARKEWWIGTAKEAEAAELIGLPPPVKAGPAAEPATPAVRDAASVAAEFAATIPIESLTDQEKVAPVRKAYLGECFGSGLIADPAAANRLFDEAVSTCLKASTDPQAKVGKALQTAREGLQISGLKSVRQYGREDARYSLLVEGAEGDFEVNLGSAEDIFKPEKIEARLADSPELREVEWPGIKSGITKGKWKPYALSIFQCAKFIKTVDDADELAGWIMEAMRAGHFADDLERKEDICDYHRAGKHSESASACVYRVRGDKGIFVSLSNLSRFVRNEYQQVVSPKKLSGIIQGEKLGFKEDNAYKRVETTDKHGQPAGKLSVNVNLWHGRLPDNAAR